MPSLAHPTLRARSGRHWLLHPWPLAILAAGALLRLTCIVYPRLEDDDTEVYRQLGYNLFHFGTYGFRDDGVVTPTLIRLPGYPIFLQLLGGHAPLVFAVQSVLDLAACVLVAAFVRRACGRRAGLAALALSSTCYFTAAYAACALTESLSVFAVAASVWSLGRFLAPGPTAFLSGNLLRRLLPAALSCALAMLLRPDGALLTLASLIALAVYGIRQAGMRPALRAAAAFLLLAVLPLVPWTIRNARTFHVFEPLAPRHVNDPGERVTLGFYRWLRTWSVDFETTGTVFWHAGSEPIDPRELPPRAFDNPAEQRETESILAEYNRDHNISPALDDRFHALADARIRRHPVRTYVTVPLMRVADMWLRPRTEGTTLDAAWWHFSAHTGQSLLCVALALMNCLYLGAALLGFCRRPPLLVFFASYLLLRCVLLATLENPEPRYTLEGFPLLFALGGAAFRRPSASATSANDSTQQTATQPRTLATA